MAQAIQLVSEAARGPAPHRLQGALAATTVVGASSAAKERILVQGADSIAVRAKGAVTTTVNLKLHPMLSDATLDDAVGTRAAAGAPTDVVLTTNTEGIIEYTLKGERFVEIEIDVAASSSFTVTHIDVYIRP